MSALRLTLLTALSVVAVIADLGAAMAGDIAVTGAWMRALPEGLPAAGYFVLHNGSPKVITLTGARSVACGSLMLHKSQTVSGMSSMDDVEKVEIAPGATVTFAPGGYHLMCMHPNAALEPGAKIAISLNFADGAKLDTLFSVRGPKGR